jgi:hypothetical protein
MGLAKALAGCALGATLVGASFGVPALLESPDPGSCPRTADQRTRLGSSDAHKGSGHHGAGHPADDMVRLGPTCNNIELVAPYGSTYVPDVRRATTADRERARTLLTGVNEFCSRHSAAELQSAWRPGSDPDEPTHFFNPDKRSRGLDAANPRAALIYDGQVGGVMLSGAPLPLLGSIPRAHSHDESDPVEMLHVYCTADLQDAFTPNRLLGVEADAHALRLKIGPALLDLEPQALRAVLSQARSLVAGRAVDLSGIAVPADGAADPVLQAMRIEMRRSLLLLGESQLRRVWTSVKSHQPG